jgi:putative flippase GtrA
MRAVRLKQFLAAKRPYVAQLARFATVGVVGLLVDTGVLLIYLRFVPGAFFTGRAVSYLCAATATWALNRWFTFATPHPPSLREWGMFLLLNLSGGSINYLIYAALITSFTFAATYPAIAVFAGAVAGLGVNFTVSRRFVFARS